MVGHFFMPQRQAGYPAALRHSSLRTPATGRCRKMPKEFNYEPEDAGDADRSSRVTPPLGLPLLCLLAILREERIVRPRIRNHDSRYTCV
ncbi:hypothetical protein E2C01_065207 [Portunus trituberculatus]|uniref:Uncharacterized protein n=1 Tax=Portunus trituberculatus TaxID=210409 RepID=A0A5B7HI87_PORTR|nr:hypothetical protein [Portunus trituberculatus]